MNNNETPSDAKYDFRGQPQLFLLLLPFVIRPFAELFHITANYHVSEVIQGL